MPRGKSRKLPHNSALSGLSEFLERLQRPGVTLQSDWDAIVNQVRWETDSLDRAVQVFGEAKFLMWMHVPFVVLNFGDYPTPRSLLDRIDRSMKEVCAQLIQTRPVSPQELASVSSTVLGLLASRIVILEGVRQKYFSYLKSDFYSDLYPALIDMIRTLIGAPALHPSDYVTLLLCNLVTFEGSILDKLDTMTERTISAESRLKQKAEQLGLDWNSLIGARWDSSFGIRRGCSRYPFLPDLICDLWCLLAPHYGAGPAADQPIVTKKLCDHISGIIRESMPGIGGSVESRVVKDIVTYRYNQSVGEGEKVSIRGLYTCFSCGKTTFLNAGDTVLRCGSHNPSSQVSRLWLRNEEGIFRMGKARRKQRSSQAKTAFGGRGQFRDR